MRSHHRFFGAFQQFSRTLIVQMARIDDHAVCLHPLDKFPAAGFKPFVFALCPVRKGQFIFIVPSQCDQSHAVLSKRLFQFLQITAKNPAFLYGKQCADDAITTAGFQVCKRTNLAYFITIFFDVRQKRIPHFTITNIRIGMFFQIYKNRKVLQ